MLINGERVVDDRGRDAVIDVRTDESSFYQADTFSAQLLLSTAHVTPSFDAPVDLRQSGPAFWSNLVDAEVQVFIGYPVGESFEPHELDRCVIGAIDDVQCDFASNTVSLIGRDLTSRLIDTKTVGQFDNKTASAIVELLAREHDLTPVVTPTTTLAGAYYREDRVSMQDSRPQWDLITYLAEREGFQAYVIGRELHFEPRKDPDTSEPYVIEWRPPTLDRAYPISNALRLVTRRNLSFSRDIEVQVRSFNTKQRRGFTVTARRQRIRNRVITGQQRLTLPPQVYTLRIPNLTEDEAQRRANAYAEQMSRDEMLLSAAMPGDGALTTRTPVRLVGTGGAFDQTYFVSSLVRSWNQQEGYLMSIEAKNHSPESQALP